MHFFLLSQMMWSIVFFCWRLSLNLISTLYQAQKLKLMEMQTPSPLRTIYVHYTIGLDSDVLHDLVPFVQFKKREKHPWRSATFSKVFRLKAFTFTKNNTPPWVFFTFFKLYKWYQIAQNITSEFAINTWELKNSWEQLFWGNLGSMVT